MTAAIRTRQPLRGATISVQVTYGTRDGRSECVLLPTRINERERYHFALLLRSCGYPLPFFITRWSHKSSVYVHHGAVVERISASTVGARAGLISNCGRVLATTTPPGFW